jgi:hypothetical protein
VLVNIFLRNNACFHATLNQHLFVNPVRRALLNECFHALFLIFKSKQAMEETPFKAKAFSEGKLMGSIDCLFSNYVS